jgi:hypothetical protein
MLLSANKNYQIIFQSLKSQKKQNSAGRNWKNWGTVLRLELDWRITFTLFMGTNNYPMYYHLHAFPMVVIRQFSGGGNKRTKILAT